MHIKVKSSLITSTSRPQILEKAPQTIFSGFGKTMNPLKMKARATQLLFVAHLHGDAIVAEHYPFEYLFTHL